MGRAPAVLTFGRRLLELDDRRRALVGAGLVAVFVAYDALADRLPDLPLWLDTAIVAFFGLPLAFGLVWLAVPLRRRRGLLGVAFALALLGAVWYAAGLDVAANVAKLGAAALGGFWFLSLFERVTWLALVAALVPIVDALSVWRGPTNQIVGDRPEVFSALSVAFLSPGGGSFQLGLPDVMFFALYLAAAFRWRLRPGWTWFAMTAALGVTIALAVITDPFGIGGLPALPALSIAFFAANGDLLLQRRRRADPARDVAAEVGAKDPEVLARFYRDALGLDAEPAGDGLLRVQVDWVANAPGRLELGVETEEVDDLFTRAVEAGARPRRPPEDLAWGRTARLRDPEGTRIVLRDSG